MLFAYDISTPKNTPFNALQSTVIKIARGVIHHWEIYFPSGGMGEIRTRIRKGSEHVFPINPDGYLLGDNTIVKGDDFIYIKSEPFELTIDTWNIDLINPHAVYFRIFIKPLWTFSPYSDQLAQLVEDSEIMKVF